MDQHVYENAEYQGTYRSCQPHEGSYADITEFPNIEVVVDNQLLLNDILDIKNRIRPTFVQGLHNDQIQIDYRLAQSDEIKKILSKREVFDNIMDSNQENGQYL